MQKIVKKTLYTLALLAVLGTGCSRTGTEPEQPAVITADPSWDVVDGELLVKFRPEVEDALDKVQAAGRGVATRSGMTDVDRVLEILGTYSLERVFPVGNNEEATRKAGLHLWYVVRFDEDMDVHEAVKELSQLGELSKIQYSTEIKRSKIRRAVPLESVPARVASSQEGIFNDPLLPMQWHYINTGNMTGADGNPVIHFTEGCDVNCKDAWAKCKGDPEIIVAVMDEGVMYKHPDLRGNMWVNKGEADNFNGSDDRDGNGYRGDVFGYNFANDNPVISWDQDGDTGHGTHVAGTVAAVNGNGEGVCGVAGGSGASGQGIVVDGIEYGNYDGVRIMSLQIFDGQQGLSVLNEARAFKYAADNGAVILQCSWGLTSGLADPITGRGLKTDEEWEQNYPLEKESLDYFIHNAGSPNGVIEGGLAIFASGNEYAPMACYPGKFGDFISVAALAADDTPSTFTNYADGVDISAPGGDMDYHLAEEGSILSCLTPGVNGDALYGYMDGTSMACPHVSGIAALGLSYAARLHKHFKAEDFKEMLLGAVRPLHYDTDKRYYKYWQTMGTKSPDSMDLPRDYNGQMGSGAIDAGKLLSAIDGENAGVVLDLPNVTVNSGQSHSLRIDRFFPGGEECTFTAASENESVAKVSVSGNVLTVEGVSAGMASFTVTPSQGEPQSAYITVLNGDGSSGWF